jgi:outer membrane immunogenic protein
MFYGWLRRGAVASGMFLAASAGHAADMALVTKAPPAVIAGWSGFYAGLHAGYGVGNSNATSRTDLGAQSVFAPATFDTGGHGPLFGGQIGYNWQSGKWVFGLEGDFSGAGISGFDSRPPVGVLGYPVPTATFSGENFMRQSVEWLASARGRVGHTIGSGLIYATGGAAWAGIDYQANTREPLNICGGTGCAWPAAFKDVRTGWVVGAGYEWLVASNWTLRGEYLFYRFDGPTATSSTQFFTPTCVTCRATYSWGALDLHAVRLGLNYKWDGAGPAPLSAPMPAPAVRSWTGFYAGVHGGWAFTRGDASFSTARATPPGFLFPPTTFNLDDNGPLFGGQAGYNWQMANWVLGVEADLSGSGIRGFHSQTTTCVTPYCAPSPIPLYGAGSLMRQDVNWLASLRGRLGHTWGAGLIYVTGGAAWAHVDYEANTGDLLVCGFNPGCSFPAAFNKTLSGWVLGGGYEWSLWSNWTVRSEYLFYNFQGASATTSPTPVPGAGSPCVTGCSITYRWNDLDVHALRVGLNYRW